MRGGGDVMLGSVDLDVPIWKGVGCANIWVLPHSAAAVISLSFLTLFSSLSATYLTLTWEH